MSFNYHSGIREDVTNMIGEIGAMCDVLVPRVIEDAFGNAVDRKETLYKEKLWCRQLNDTLDIEGIGQLDREDLRIVAPMNTMIVPEAIVMFNGERYFVLGIDKPNVGGNITHKVAYARRELT